MASFDASGAQKDYSRDISRLFQHLEKILSQGQKRVTIYVAIASAAHMARKNPITSLWSIEPQYEQQFPIFISSLKEYCPIDPVHIFLIDPALEDPPFVVCDVNREVNKCWIKCEMFGTTMYVDEITNVHVYPMKFPVTYPGDKFNAENSADITYFLHTLNMTAIKNDWLVIIQDYSGRNISVVGDYFESELQGHHDHIIYGIAAGSDGGCYIDLTSPACNFVYQVMENYIKVVTIKCYANNFLEFVEMMNSLGSPQDKNREYEILRAQAMIYLEDKRALINNEIMSLLRQTKALSVGSMEESSMCIDDYTSKKIKSKWKIDVKEMIRYKKYDDLFHAILGILELELENFVSVIHKKELYRTTKMIISEIIGEMLSKGDPYKWYDVISRVIRECFDHMSSEIKKM